MTQVIAGYFKCGIVDSKQRGTHETTEDTEECSGEKLNTLLSFNMILSALMVEESKE